MKNWYKVVILILLFFSVILVTILLMFNLAEGSGLQLDYKKHKDNLALIAHTLENYHKQYRVYPDNLNELTPNYIESIPRYSEGDQTYNYSYFTTLNDTHYQISFWLFDKTLFGEDKRGCIYYSSDPDELSCTARGFLPETERINLSNI